MWVGRTEFDSPEVDNEVLVDAKKYYAKIGDLPMCKLKVPKILTCMVK